VAVSGSVHELIDSVLEQTV